MSDVEQRIVICLPGNRTVIAIPDGKHIGEVMMLSPAERKEHERLERLKKSLIKKG